MESIPEYTVLWMLDLDAAEIACKAPRNVLLLQRMHQIDVFSHEKIKLFITSGDLLDIQESIWHGVPILGLPILVKQFTVGSLLPFGRSSYQTVPSNSRL